MIKKIVKRFHDLKQLIEVDIWRVNLNRKSFKFLLLRNLKVTIIAVKGFFNDSCGIKSSALTYFSLLSIVPVLAIAFAISKGFGLQEYLDGQLEQLFQGQKEILEQTTEFANRMLDTTNSGLIAGISILFLLYAVISLLTNIEDIFNDIWEIKRGRSIERKFTDYLSIIIAGPILLIFSSSLNVFIRTAVESYTDSFEILKSVKPFILVLFKLTPYVLFWLLFTLLYMVLPNTRIKFGPALKAALLAAVIYTVTQWGYLEFQIGVSRYNAIYGSFAALPLFLIWLQISWMIVLFGAEVAFALQNVNTWEYDSDKLRISQNMKKRMALLVVYHLVKNFEKGEAPLDSDSLADRIQAPLRYVNQVLKELTEVGVVSEVITKSDEPAYQPGTDSSNLTVQFVINKLIDSGLKDVHLVNSEERTQIEKCLQLIDSDKLKSKGNMLLKDL